MNARSRSGRAAIALAVAIMALMGQADPVLGQSDLPSLTQTIAQAWSTGDADALAPHLTDDGIDLSLDGEPHMGVSRRQARAALARFLEDWDVEAVSVRRSEDLGGEPLRALLEFGWEPTARGTPERRSFVIFVSLQRTLDAWRIEEIRVFS